MQKYEGSILSSSGRPITYDISLVKSDRKKPVILFVHGFKGFKDWGHFNLIAEAMAEAGYVFVKMNFSHNGTTPEALSDFADLEAFGQNNYSKEVDDIGTLINHLYNGETEISHSEMTLDDFTLIGHSRGGGAAILYAKEDERVRRLVTWASINDHDKRWPNKDLNDWKQKGVHYIRNERTNQDMPMYYQIVEDYYANEQRLNIPLAVKNLNIPFMAIHGSLDETVPKEVLEEFASLNPNVETVLLPKAGHTFGGKHPYDRDDLGQIARTLIDTTLKFLNN